VRMRPMHAVKIPHTHERWTEVGGNVFEFVEDKQVITGQKRAPGVLV
jgi:hypothetical protein